MDSLNDRVNDLIIKGKIDDILDILENEAPEYDNEVILLKSNYKDLIENQISGTISDDDLRLEVNKLKKAILLLVDRIEDLERKVALDKSSKKLQTRTKRNNKPIIYGAIAVLALLLIYFLPFSATEEGINENSIIPDEPTVSDKDLISDDIDGTFEMAVRTGNGFTPSLIYPSNNSEIPQPFRENWKFRWEDPPSSEDLAGFHMIVIGSGASEPLLDTIYEYNELIMMDECSHIPQQFTEGWKWKVRSLFYNDEWSEWTPYWEFNVEHFDEEDFCLTCPHLCN